MAFSYFNRQIGGSCDFRSRAGGKTRFNECGRPADLHHYQCRERPSGLSGRYDLENCRRESGYYKKGRPADHRGTQPRVLRLFSKICQERKAPFFRVGKEFRCAWGEDGDFDYEGLNRKLWSVHLNLKGFHQVLNATTALGAMEVLEDLGYPVSTAAMIDGLREVDWPGRLELVSSSPRVILDGAHNPAGALVLKESLEKEFQYHHLILLVGIMKDKDFRPCFIFWPPSRITSFSPDLIRTVPRLPRYSRRHWTRMGRKQRLRKISRRQLREALPHRKGRPFLHYRVLYPSGKPELFASREEIMRPHPFILGFFFLLFIAASSSPAHGKVGEVSVTKGEGPVDIEADDLTYDRETQTYEAHGQVEASRGDLSLKADHARLNMATKEMVAWGT